MAGNPGRPARGRHPTTEEPTDSSVIRASEDDPRLFGIVFERYYAAVDAYLQRRVGAGEAEELASEVFLEALRSRRRYDHRYESAKGWLFGIATNLLLRSWRRERRQLRAYARTAIDPLGGEIDGAESRVDAQRSRLVLARALASLSRDQRDVLLLHAWADLSDAEIAAALNLPIGTVQSRLSRARSRMREAIGPDRERNE